MMVTRALKRFAAVAVLVTFFFGLSMPIANASMAWCPFIKMSGKRYEICIPIP
jgi:hypothetical protein